MFKSLIQRPAYIFKFAIYVLFICFAAVFYFSDILGPQQDESLSNLYALLMALYGGYRLIRTWQDFQAELRHEDE